MKSEIQRIKHESEAQRERIKENQDKIKLNKQLPYLVGNIIEVLELESVDGEEDGMAQDVDLNRCILGYHLIIHDQHQVRKVGGDSDVNSSDNIFACPRTC